MKKLLLLIMGVIFITMALYADNLSPVGWWKTIDDETGQAKSIVNIWVENGEMKGKILELFRKPDEDQNPTCAEGSRDLTGKPIKGATIMWGLTEDKNGWWDGGKILDPKKGKIYNCKIRTIEDGTKLQVRGYIKVIFRIGRSQTWERVPEPVEKEKPKEMIEEGNK
ncbi:MAG: DUF2147 domain-containing protein [Candidatus Celaenobacter antarcticus]|nr:DUF2147 domain-containing protein [Candidatus Celaenobacter antarcticus]MDP8313581.1 DUF2147 domain-containing protein [Candidatus Celaenobacter antarcticus]